MQTRMRVGGVLTRLLSWSGLSRAPHGASSPKGAPEGWGSCRELRQGRPLPQRDGQPRRAARFRCKQALSPFPGLSPNRGDKAITITWEGGKAWERRGNATQIHKMKRGRSP